MNWFLSILIGLLTGVVGVFSAGFLASLNVRWYRISSFEGGSGYYVVFIALAGGIVGVITGVICARVVAGWTEPGFLKGVGVAFGSMLSLVFVVGVLCRLGADIRPTIDGKSLKLAVEIRLPRSIAWPVEKGEYGSHLYLENAAGKTKSIGDLEPEKATPIDGRWTLATTLSLNTSAAHKRLRAFFNKEHDRWFFLQLRSHPRQSDLTWSAWLDAGVAMNETRPTPDEAFQLRYKVQVVEPPPAGPSYAEVQAQEAAAEQATFDAIPADAPVATWLEYTKYGTAPERLAIAIENITNREDFVSELCALMVGGDHEVAKDALYCVQHLTIFPPELNDAVREAGQKIIAMLRAFNATKPEDDPSYQGAADISVRFSAWHTAVETLRKQADGDFTPELQEILQLARERPDSICLRGDVVRVASYYLKEWAGVAPLPSDPSPR